MKNLTRCESVYLTVGNPWDLEHLRGRIGVYLLKSLSSKSSSTSEKLVERMIQATLTAIAMSELHIQALGISTGFQMNNARCIHPDILIGSSALLSESPMKHLSRLYLVLDKHPGLGNTSKWTPPMVQFIESFPSLSHLCLGFVDSDDWGRFSELCKTLLIPKLEILSLRFIHCTSIDLAFFLLRHQRTLRWIQLDWVKLTDGVKSWRWLFEVVRDSLDITSLGTRGCSGQHSYAVTELEDIDAHCLTDILESLPYNGQACASMVVPIGSATVSAMPGTNGTIRFHSAERESSEFDGRTYIWALGISSHADDFALSSLSDLVALRDNPNRSPFIRIKLTRHFDDTLVGDVIAGLENTRKVYDNEMQANGSTDLDTESIRWKVVVIVAVGEPSKPHELRYIIDDG
ncbi:hypothetical protein FOXB_01256 [Fusarium oxysporum f. sp. conglutinans Fo5176]|uniref:Uncharacterized protein n=1 Tax=Fusarium oxysporum (strain Fo5176) TaxID=660025 RepID=F9F4D1_FUSOF|nr:hypothetical protein FOXB_01256 [Fusarium oxysporum f. sp. conglutinans Fo5176]